jgi:hypothetical protein
MYSEDNIGLIPRYEKRLAEVLNVDGGRPSSILTTKVMLGILGNVPAFDAYCRKGLGITTFGR